MSSSSDDEADIAPRTVSNYDFDCDSGVVSFAVLPVQWHEGERVEENSAQQIFLRGNADNGLQKIYKQVVAWKFDLLNTNPVISVLMKDKVWIKLLKPRKSYEEIIRTVLITVHFLHLVRRNPDASWKTVWDSLTRIFRSYDVRPSENDLVDHIGILSEAAKRDSSLCKCKILLAFIEEKPRKRVLVHEDVKAATMSGFIVDDIVPSEDESTEEDDIFDSVCAFCDNGGELLSCEGKCMRSFHPKKEDGIDSLCETLCLTDSEVEALNPFLCKNCIYGKHQCFVCGKLGSSEKSSCPEVFQCANATCGYSYHPRCIARLLCNGDETAMKELQEKITAGETFACPRHKCRICKQGENKEIEELQFAVCRRCPTSYHRKCMPREIIYEDEAKKDPSLTARAWTNLLPNRILMYCLKHEILDDLETPVRDIRFPVEERMTVSWKKRKLQSELVPEKVKALPIKGRHTSPSGVSPLSEHAAEAPKNFPPVQKVKNSERSEEVLPGPDSSRKAKAGDGPRMPQKKKIKTTSAFVNRSTSANKVSMGDRLFEIFNTTTTTSNTTTADDAVKAPQKQLSANAPSLDADSERRLLALIKEAESSISLDDILRKQDIPSTHTQSSRTVLDKTVTLGKVDGAVEAVRTALKKLGDGCSMEDAKALCEPGVLSQVFKWKNKLKVYLAPFLYGMRYTSFGRHFTKVEKLQEIVNMLHCYVQNDDMIVDFCCGANDFSCLMKKKIDEVEKNCLYKNYDVIQPKNTFNFEKRDWMSVQPNELPNGSRLIMGLNPPFGVKAALANKFIYKALEFKPKLIILIVPPETQRLDEKNPPYDLVWEDDQFLAGKSFYLPGSVDENDKQMDDWNVTAPVLYLWSHRDWSAEHKAIAAKHGHPSKQQHKGSKMEEDLCEEGIQTYHSMEVDNLPVEDKKNGEVKFKKAELEGHDTSSSGNSNDGEGQDSGSCKTTAPKDKERNFLPSQPDLTSRGKKGKDEDKNGRGKFKESSDNKRDGGKDAINKRPHQEMPFHMSLSSMTQVRSSGEPEPMSTQSLERVLQSVDSEPVYRHRINSINEGYPHGINRSAVGLDADERYRSYMADLERESEIRSQIHRYGEDPALSFPRNYHDGGYGYGTNVSAMQRYAPRLDELNHPGMLGNLISEPIDRNNIYDPRVQRPRYSPDPMGFVPGPHDSYSYHHSAGWIND